MMCALCTFLRASLLITSLKIIFLKKTIGQNNNNNILYKMNVKWIKKKRFFRKKKYLSNPRWLMNYIDSFNSIQFNHHHQWWWCLFCLLKKKSFFSSVVVVVSPLFLKYICKMCNMVFSSSFSLMIMMNKGQAFIPDIHSFSFSHR